MFRGGRLGSLTSPQAGCFVPNAPLASVGLACSCNRFNRNCSESFAADSSRLRVAAIKAITESSF